MDPITNISELLEAIDTFYTTPASSKITGVETNAVLHAMIALIPPAEAGVDAQAVRNYLAGLPGYGPGRVLSNDFTWASYDRSLPQLSAVSGFTLGTPTSHSVNMNWGAVINAEGYILQKDVSEDFANPVTIYTGTAHSFLASELSGAFSYFFRIKAIAPNYQDSAFATGSATTASS